MPPEKIPRDIDCDRAEEMYSEKFEGALCEEDSRLLEGHLARCSRCRMGYARFEAALHELHSLQPGPVPESFVASLQDAVASTAMLPRRRFGTALPWAVAAAAAVVAVASLVTRPEPRVVVREVAIRSPTPSSEPAERAERARTAPWSVVIDTAPLARALERLARAASRLPPARGSIPPRILIDTAALAEILGSAVDSALERLAPVARQLGESYLAQRAVEQLQHEPRPLPPEPAVARADRLLPRPQRPRAVRVVRDAGGVVAIEAAGEPSRVIPILLDLLDDPDAAVAAAAHGHLESLQEHLALDRGVPGPVRTDSRAEQEERELLSRQTGDPPSSFEESDATVWKRWWRSNQVAIAGG